MNRLFYVFCLILFISCKKDDSAKIDITLKIEKNSIELSANGESKSLKVTTNAETFETKVPNEAGEWCTAKKQGSNIIISVTKNNELTTRQTTVTVTAGDKQETISVSQAYTLPTPDAETKIKITGGEASSEETTSTDNKFANSFDEDYNTIWHTNWNEGNKYPYTITYHLEETDQLNYVIYYPRTDGSNGKFGQIEIQAQSRTSTDFVKVMDYDCGKKSTESKIMLTNAVINPKSVRFIIKSGEGGHASCAEMEFYRGTGKETKIGTEIPLGGNTYFATAAGSSSVTENGLINWSDPETIFSTYFKVKQAGDLELYLKYRGNTSESEIEVTCNDKVFPVLLPKPQSRDAYAYIGKVSNVTPGYIKVDIKGKKRNDNIFAIPTALAVDGTASQNMTFVSSAFSSYWGRRGPSVHMAYTLPTDDCEWFYNEVTVPEEMDPVGSYFMSNGFDGGYFGMQVNSATERRVLFSVWSPYETDDPSTIPDEYKVKVVKKGEGVKDNDFGGEGSGGQTYLLYNWKTNQTYKFLTRIRPVENNYSEFTSYFFIPEKGKWQLISQMLRPKTQTYYKSAHSFLENFNNETGHLTRKAYYNNQWVYTTSGNWIELNKGTFTVDATGSGGWRLDYKGGADASGFFLQNCGFFNETTSKGTSFERTKNNTAPNVEWGELE
ncbi:DUF3472 domain-containing protein [Bacteroides sp. 519]|uniref:DUF3472 domain-containing protein n=1 Tax=Bacteroides sp. 519 TaxID=2302937 RepID=UPI0013D23661|nr:DUF3472 domain-containing protein [Bacteroides sp. 519]NDV57600.1 DUF3472 domain-containing protein [Bacteroides sp. 519]